LLEAPALVEIVHALGVSDNSMWYGALAPLCRLLNPALGEAFTQVGLKSLDTTPPHIVRLQYRPPFYTCGHHA
jgi:hypothetical protein